MLDLTEIKGRLAEATSGLWGTYRTGGHLGVENTDEEMLFLENSHGVTYAARDADATLIAHAPSDIAALVAEIEWLRGSIEAALLGSQGVEVVDPAAFLRAMLRDALAGRPTHGA